METCTKPLDQYFADWEPEVFGYGYGTGDDHVLGALKTFMEAIPQDGSYDYEVLERAVTAPVAWLLINALARGGPACSIEYGTSPRYGWLTAQGKALAAYVRTHTVEQLVEAAYQSDNYIHCFPDHCNCTAGDCRSGNPFWAP